jgi:hypothetical protein
VAVESASGSGVAAVAAGQGASAAHHNAHDAVTLDYDVCANRLGALV